MPPLALCGWGARKLLVASTERRLPVSPCRGPLRVQVNSFSLSSLIVWLSSSCSLSSALNSSGGGRSALRRACRILSSISRWRWIVSASFWRSSAIVTPSDATGPSAYGSGGGSASKPLGACTFDRASTGRQGGTTDAAVGGRGAGATQWPGSRGSDRARDAQWRSIPGFPGEGQRRSHRVGLRWARALCPWVPRFTSRRSGQAA